MKLILKKKNSKTSRRVEKILESKNALFKKKFKLLSLLSETNIRKNSTEIDTLTCYTNSLIESNGSTPSINTIKRFLTKSFKRNDFSSQLLKIENTLNLNYKQDTTSSIILEELEKIDSKNYKLDQKIIDTLLESVNQRKSIFYESEFKKTPDDNGAVVDSKAIEDVAKKIEPNVVDEKEVEEKSREYGVRKIKSELEKLHSPVVEKIKSYSNKAKRKVYIIFQIHNYLHVFRTFNPPASKTEKSNASPYAINSFSYMTSGLTEEEVKKIDGILDSILSIGAGAEIDFESEEISEKILLKLLKMSMGKSSQADQNFKDFFEELEMSFPIEGSQKYDYLTPQHQRNKDQLSKFGDDVGDMSDEEFEEFKRRQDAGGYDDDNAIHNARIDAEEGPYIDPNTKEPITWVDISSMTDEEISKIPMNVGIKLVIDADRKNRGKIYQELMNHASSPEMFDKYVKQYFSGKDLKPMSYADIARTSGGDFKGSQGTRQDIMKIWHRTVYYSSDIDHKADIYAAIGEKWIEALRTLDLMEDEAVEMKKLKSYKGTKLVDYFKKLENVITVPSKIKKYLEENNEEDFDFDEFDELGELEDFSVRDNLSKKDQEDLAIAKSLLSDENSFKTFSAKLLADYYDEKIWKAAPRDLMFAIKEYFDKRLPQLNFDASGGLNNKSAKDINVVDPEEGRGLLNPIINWMTGRSGVSTGGNRIGNPKEMNEERKEKLKKGLGKALEHYKSINPSITYTMTEKDYDNLVKDALSPNGIIGSAYEDKRHLTKEAKDKIVSWIMNLRTSYIQREVSEALVYNDVFEERRAKQRIFNKKTERNIKNYAGKQLLPDYISPNASELKKHAEFLSDEYGYENPFEE